jgi:hypothetical protein
MGTVDPGMVLLGFLNDTGDVEDCEFDLGPISPVAIEVVVEHR